MLFSNIGYYTAASKILDQVGHSLILSLTIPLFKKWGMFPVEGIEIAPKFNPS